MYLCLALAQSDVAEPAFELELEAPLEQLEKTLDERGKEIDELALQIEMLARLAAEHKGVDLAELALEAETGDNDTEPEAETAGELASVDVDDTAED